ncbi:MAG: YihY/virulence factor BrkB family protein, partial [Acidobacteria bacterium]|nr:YihY/virulence factor BrkB family protein [Acidobacteriota bacterium]
MNVLRPIPEVNQFESRAWRLVRDVGVRPLIVDSYRRLRHADGLTHARSLAFVTALVMIQVLVGFVGLATVVQSGNVSATVVSIVHRMVPGPAGHLLTSAVTQAHVVAARHHYAALVLGTGGALVTLTMAMAQLESGFNRLYGMTRDRPWGRRYALAALFAISVGSLIAASFICLTLGRTLLVASHDQTLAAGWDLARWPVGIALAAGAVMVLLRWMPRRRQPRLSWLALGASVAILCWALATACLGWFYALSPSYGSTYGPLAGIIALLGWCFLSSLSLLFGAAVCAQLESV